MSPRRLCSPGRRRGLTLLEVLIAVAVASAFIAGLLAAFVQVLSASNRAETTMRSLANGRTALDAMAVAIKQANYFPGKFYFQGRNNYSQPLDAGGLPYGDAIDNDGDGRVDEERRNALDDDGDWTSQDDRHAAFSSGQTERAAFVGRPDLGDAHVDEDNVFDGDLIEFVQYADPADPNPVDKDVAFSIGSFEGRDHVLLQRTLIPAYGPNPTVEIAPLAEGVLGFNALYWQPNGTDHYWLEAWDSSGPEALPPPGLRLPAAVVLSLDLYADSRPIEGWRPGQPARVETVSTVVNIEQVIQDSLYPRP
ncbi:MAG: prepilin-type N-terminal cleavage/methylation domain-containing protein [Candidatus Sumerlaeota bacterium]|nr:prepilin-type N-terminal cleavage/methylation domain-containing protein [Candidatus Sumerlaeota bacterium]